jgi:ABC-type sugar transport system ATPase subunit
MKKEVLFKTEGLTKTFLSTKAVQDVSIEIYKGEVRGLIGENGSGKSTLSSMISGILQPDAGKMFMNGSEYSPKNQIDAKQNGVSIILQEMSTIEGITVTENIFLGNETEFTFKGMINKRKMNEKAKAILDDYNITHIDPSDDVAFYSFEDRKMIELVRSIHFNPKLFIVDETTTALSQKERKRLLDIIKELRDKGTSILLITHDLQELLEMCDTITVLKDGQLVDTIENVNIHEDLLKKMMVGRELEGKYYREDYTPALQSEAVLKIRNIEIPGILRDINFDLYKGEILGIGGLTDSGMHELGKVLFGAVKANGGSVKLTKNGKNVGSIGEAIAGGIGYASKNRDQEALMLSASIKDNICLPSLDQLQQGVHISGDKEKKMASEGAEKLNVKMSSIEQYVMYLSGGNKQKVVLAKWLSRGSDILILDAPTRGIDVMVKASIYSLMKNITDSGKSIIMISEEMQELIGMCDRILIVKNGELSAEFERSKDLTEEEIINHMI